MSYNGIKQVVIDKTNNQVLRWGYCDFENDGSFDGSNEEIIENDFNFQPDIDQQDWFWDDVGQTFYTTGTYDNRNQNFLVQELNKSNLISKEIWYHTDNGNGTYSGPVKEIEYVYSGKKMIKKIIKTFYPSGRTRSTDEVKYYTNGNKQIIKP